MAAKIKIQGFEPEILRMKRWMEKETQDATKVFRGYAADLFSRLVKSSPQDSGDFTANWNYSLNAPNTFFLEGKVIPNARGKRYKQGDMPAIAIAYAENFMNDAKIKLGDTVYMTNRSTHEDNRGRPDPYYQKILSGTMNLRDANRTNTVQSAFAKFKDAYPRVLKGREMGYLKSRRVGTQFS